jgi:hypothetical protein
MTYDLTEIRNVSSFQERIEELLEAQEAGDPIDEEDINTLLRDCADFFRGIADGES